MSENITEIVLQHHLHNVWHDLWSHLAGAPNSADIERAAHYGRAVRLVGAENVRIIRRTITIEILEIAGGGA